MHSSCIEYPYLLFYRFVPVLDSTLSATRGTVMPYDHPGYRILEAVTCHRLLAMPSLNRLQSRARGFQGVVDIRLRSLEKASHLS